MTNGLVGLSANRTKNKLWLIVFWVVLWSANGFCAENAVVLQSGYEQYSLNAYASFLIDRKGKYSLDEALQSDDWQSNVSGSVLSFGFTNATVWIKVHLAIPKDPAGPWHIVVPYPLLEQTQLFVTPMLGAGPMQEIKQQSFHADVSQVHSNNINFRLPSDMQGPVDIVLRASSTTSLQVPLELWSQTFLVNRQNLESLIWGLYFGVLLALIAYNTFLYLSMRDWAYFHYVLYLLSIVGLMLCISGFGPLYVWRSPLLSQQLLPLFTGMTTFWAILFTLSFLHGNGIHPFLRGSMWVAVSCSLILVVVTLLHAGDGARMAGLLSILAVGLVIAAGLNAFANGVVIARYFVLAWTTFALGALLYLFNVFGWIPVSRFSNHAVQVGSALEAVLLSFSLAHRIKEERQQKLNALEQKNSAEEKMKQAQTLALQQALHDSLTQRPNDAFLIRRMQDMIRQQGQWDAFSLVLFYFSQMKDISSSMGRRLAEEVFSAVVEDVNQMMAADPQSIAIELQSDSYVAVTEFGSVLALCAVTSEGESLQNYTQRYLAFFEKSIDVDGMLLNLDVVCGIASYPKQGDRADLLLQHASAARDFGLRTSEPVTFYSSEIEAFSRRRLMLVGGLTEAIKKNELELYLQPQLQCQDLRLRGAEVLLRWNSPRFGSVSPQEFIEIAEDAGLMDVLTRFVVERAFALMRGFHQSGLRISFSINLSIQNLVDPGIVGFVLKAAQEAGIHLADVVLEVTETSVSENMDTVIDNLKQLAETGCCIALDDFGTGYSSLAYLSRLPIHELKIDRSFIAQMYRSDSDYRIVENTVKLARALQIQTVAEGVEDASTLSQVTRLGCDRVQGFYLGKPMPVGAFREWVLRKVS